MSMIKLRGFGGKSRHWDDNLESFTLMAGLAAVTSRIEHARSGLFRVRWPPDSTPGELRRAHWVLGPRLNGYWGSGTALSDQEPSPRLPYRPSGKVLQTTRQVILPAHPKTPWHRTCPATRPHSCGTHEPVDPRRAAPSGSTQEPGETRPSPVFAPGPAGDACGHRPLQSCASPHIRRRGRGCRFDGTLGLRGERPRTHRTIALFGRLCCSR